MQHQERHHGIAGSAIEPLEGRLLLADTTVGIKVKDGDASETDPAGAGLGQFTVLRAGNTTGSLDVAVRFSPGASSATSGADFVEIVKTVRIRAGRNYAHFDVRPIDDAVADPSETVVVKVHTSTDYDINPARPKVRLRIADNEPVVGIRAVDAAAAEDGTDPAQFRISRTGSTAEPLTVGYYIRNTSTATSGSDFTALPGSVTIPAGQANATFSLTPIDDGDEEGEETVTLTLRFDPGQVRAPHSATATLADNDGSRAGWWNDGWDFRVPLSVEAASHDRSDKPVERRLAFTDLFNEAGAPGSSLILNSIRVIETSADGLNVIDEDVPLQFDPDGDFNASTNATGTLTFLMEDATDAGQARHYHVYFDNEGSFDAPSVAARVTTTDNVMDEGFSSVRIATATATYFYQKEEGGFSSVVDTAGNDWIGWNSTPGSGGEFRGVPNLGPAGFHPGRDHDVETVIVSQGPLKTTIVSTDDDGNKVRWEFFPTYARMTVLAFEDPYYFLYEGTPGGSMNNDDFVVRSDGTQTDRNTTWNNTDGLGSGNGQEWVYFGDSGADRFFFLAHHETDNLEDSYFNLDDNMTVFGFGRHNTPSGNPDLLMTAAPNTFTIGLASGGAFAGAAATINGAYQGLNVAQAAAQTRR